MTTILLCLIALTWIARYKSGYRRGFLDGHTEMYRWGNKIDDIWRKQEIRNKEKQGGKAL